MNLPERVRQLLFDQQASAMSRLANHENSEAEALEDASRHHVEANRLRELIREIDATLRGVDETQALPTVELPLPEHLSPRRRRR